MVLLSPSQLTGKVARDQSPVPGRSLNVKAIVVVQAAGRSVSLVDDQSH